MAAPDSSMRAARWLRGGCRAGLAAGLPVPLGIVAVKLVPSLAVAYPLLLLPLLLAGPLAVRRLRCADAARAALLAGTISGAIAAGSLALALALFGDWFWALTAAAAAPPMPPLPRIMVLPTAWLTWPHQDVLFFQPPLALSLGVLTWTVGPSLGALGRPLVRILPRSLAGRLRLAFGTLIALTLLLGLAGFGMIEEMHLRAHRVQLRADWQRQLGLARAALDEELAARLADPGRADPASSIARLERAQQVYQTLGSPNPRPGIAVGRDDLVAVLNEYRAPLDDAVAAQHALRAAANDPAASLARLVDATAALGRLQRAVEADTTAMLASSDLSHHQRLIVVMVLVGLIAGLGLWTGERVLEAIGGPLAQLGAHLRQVARGDFGARVPARGPNELRQLGESVNQMTADLARLYAVERERRAMAEAVATREHELSVAKEFWTNTLLHDLKSPLTLIAGWGDLLEHERLTSQQQDAVQQIQVGVRMLEDLVADINDSFRLQADALPIRRAPIDPAQLLQNVVAECRRLDRPAPAVQIADGVGPVLADARLVGRVLHNLIGNAYKHAGGGAGVVLVVEAGPGSTRFAVDDDGPGIPISERERIFERFMQGIGAAHGSGLGLAFCKLVIQQLGGRIWAETSPRGGARIAFELPRPPSERLMPASLDGGAHRASRVA
jgi:signal transduction histidine kinase